MVTSVVEIGFALIIAGTASLIVDGSIQLPPHPDAWFAVTWLGLLGSGLAYLVFFRLLGRWGATRTSLVAYLMPVVGLVLGAVVLHEAIDARLLLGTALVIAGIAIVNVRFGTMRLRRAPASEDAG
jgi:drug/metabolite transporter (DMT)-like permease